MALPTEGRNMPIDLPLEDIQEFEYGRPTEVGSSPAPYQPYFQPVTSQPIDFGRVGNTIGDIVGDVAGGVGRFVEESDDPFIAAMRTGGKAALDVMGKSSELTQGGLGNIAALDPKHNPFYIDQIRKHANEMGLDPTDPRVMLAAGRDTWHGAVDEPFMGVKGALEMAVDPTNIPFAGAGQIRNVASAAGAFAGRAGATATRIGDEALAGMRRGAPRFAAEEAGMGKLDLGVPEIVRGIRHALEQGANPTEVLDAVVAAGASPKVKNIATGIRVSREMGIADDEIANELVKNSQVVDDTARSKIEATRLARERAAAAKGFASDADYNKSKGRSPAGDEDGPPRFEALPTQEKGKYVIWDADENKIIHEGLNKDEAVRIEADLNNPSLKAKLDETYQITDAQKAEAAAPIPRPTLAERVASGVDETKLPERAASDKADAAAGRVPKGDVSTSDSTGFIAAFSSAKGAVTDTFVRDAWDRLSQGKKLLFSDNPSTLENRIQKAFDSGQIKSSDDVRALVQPPTEQPFPNLMKSLGEGDAPTISSVADSVTNPKTTIASVAGDKVSPIRNVIDDKALGDLKGAAAKYKAGTATTQDLVDLRTARKFADKLAAEGDTASARRIQNALGTEYRATEGVKMARAPKTTTAATTAGGEPPKGPTKPTAESAPGGGDDPLGTKPGPKVDAEKIADDLNNLEKSLDVVGEISKWLNVPRVAMTAFDLSGSGRQGGMFFARHNKEWRDAFQRQLKAITMDDDEFRKVHDAFVQRTTDNGGNKLYLADTGMSLTAAEEKFIRPTFEGLKKYPVLKQWVTGIEKSERAYITMLNSVRSDVFNNIVENAVQAGKPLSQAQKDRLATFINHATGRGTFVGPKTTAGGRPLFNVGAKGERAGLLEAAGAIGNNLLNTVFFAPRFALSRWQTGADVATAFGSVVKDVVTGKGIDAVDAEILTTTLAYIGSIESVIQLARLGGGTVGDDPTESEFQKLDIGRPSLFKGSVATALSALGIGSSTYETSTFDEKGKSTKSGETTIKMDPWGSFQQNIVLIARELQARKRQNERGEDRENPYVYDTTGEPTQSYLRKKFSPQMDIVEQLRTGRDAINKPVTPEGMIGRGLYPFVVREFAENTGILEGQQTDAPKPGQKGRKGGPPKMVNPALYGE